MAAVSQPLYSLDRDAFDKAVNSLVSQAFPGFTVGFRDEPDNSSLVPLKKLPDSLASSGPAGACANCHLNVLEGCMVDICLACGSRGHAAGIVSPLQWNGSIAQQRFLQCIPYKAPRTKRRSSKASTTPIPSPSSNFLDGPAGTSPAAFPLDGSPALFSQGSSNGSTTLRGVASPDSPWDSSFDTAAPNQVEDVFSLAEAALEMEKLSGKPAAASRDASPLDDFFAQLGGIPVGAQKAQATQKPATPSATVDAAVQAILDTLPDLSFLLADHLSVPEKDPGKFPPEVLPVSSSAATSSSQAASAEFPARVTGIPGDTTLLAASAQVTSSAREDSQDDEWGDFES